MINALSEELLIQADWYEDQGLDTALYRGAGLLLGGGGPAPSRLPGTYRAQRDDGWARLLATFDEDGSGCGFCGEDNGGGCGSGEGTLDDDIEVGDGVGCGITQYPYGPYGGDEKGDGDGSGEGGSQLRTNLGDGSSPGLEGSLCGNGRREADDYYLSEYYRYSPGGEKECAK